MWGAPGVSRHSDGAIAATRTHVYVEAVNISLKQSKHTRTQTHTDFVSHDLSQSDCSLHRGETFIICLGFSLRHARCNERDLRGSGGPLPPTLRTRGVGLRFNLITASPLRSACALPNAPQERERERVSLVFFLAPPPPSSHAAVIILLIIRPQRLCVLI